MNKHRQASIEKIKNVLAGVKEQLDELISDELSYSESIPEGLAQSERAETSEQCIWLMQYAANEVSTAISNLEDAINV